MAIVGFGKGDSLGGHLRNKKGILLLGGLIVVVLFAFFAGVSVPGSSNPKSCVKCHVMEPYYFTWQNSPHAGFDCNSCHVEPGTNMVSVKIQRFREWVVYRKGDVTLPITGSKEMTNEVCLTCHSTNRVISPVKDVRMDFHVDHIGYGTSCVDCHYEVAHAGISKKAEFVYSEDKMASFKNTSYSDFTLTKTICLECHDGKRATSSCSACHTNVDPE